MGDLGFKGALINGYTNVGEDEAAVYLDEQPAGLFASARASAESDACDTRLSGTGRFSLGIYI